MGEKEKVLVQDKPGRLAQTARGFSISLALDGFDWYDTSCNGALAGRIDIT